MWNYITQGALCSKETLRLSYAIYLSYLTTLATCNSHVYHRFKSLRRVEELNKSFQNIFFLKFFSNTWRTNGLNPCVSEWFCNSCFKMPKWIFKLLFSQCYPNQFSHYTHYTYKSLDNFISNWCFWLIF